MVEIIVYKKCSFLLGFLKTSVVLTPCVRHGIWEGNTTSDLIKRTAFRGWEDGMASEGWKDDHDSERKGPL